MLGLVPLLKLQWACPSAVEVQQETVGRMARQLLDRFMTQARAVVNLVGYGLATIAIAKWEGALDRATVEAVIAEQRGDIPRQITAVAHEVQH
ncbi:hypothetical protein BA011_33175 (plasmid) [Rhizobium leguminosarum]|uniref:Uncharacterized protein n=2 Tax=Rhizobium leguminosarum TaxID=384 RepID=A0A1B1CLU3_RHILE|nr:hypothetical protein BA011_33175 [Rhizobium leguminosarum]